MAMLPPRPPKPSAKDTGRLIVTGTYMGSDTEFNLNFIYKGIISETVHVGQGQYYDIFEAPVGSYVIVGDRNGVLVKKDAEVFKGKETSVKLEFPELASDSMNQSTSADLPDMTITPPEPKRNWTPWIIGGSILLGAFLIGLLVKKRRK